MTDGVATTFRDDRKADDSFEIERCPITIIF